MWPVNFNQEQQNFPYSLRRYKKNKSEDREIIDHLLRIIFPMNKQIKVAVAKKENAISNLVELIKCCQYKILNARIIHNYICSNP